MNYFYCKFKGMLVRDLEGFIYLFFYGVLKYNKKYGYDVLFFVIKLILG